MAHLNNCTIEKSNMIQHISVLGHRLDLDNWGLLRYVAKYSMLDSLEGIEIYKKMEVIRT